MIFEEFIELYYDGTTYKLKDIWDSEYLEILYSCIDWITYGKEAEKL